MDNEVATYIEKWDKSRCLSKVPKVIPDKMLGNKEFVLEVLNKIEITFPILQFVSKTLQKDKDVIAEALKHNVENWKFIPKDILYKKDIFLLVHSYTDRYPLLENMPDILKDNKEVILEVVKKHGYNIAYSSMRLRDDDEIAFEAVKTSINPLSFVSDRLKKNKQLVLAALDGYNDPSSGSEFAAAHRIIPEFLDDYDVALALVKGSGFNLHFLSDRLKDNEEIVRVAVSHPWELNERFIGEYPNRVEFSYQYASPRLRANPEIMSLAVKNNPAIYRRLPEAYRNNKEMAFEACVAYGDNIQRLPPALTDDKDFIYSLMEKAKIMSTVYNVASPRVKEDPEVVERLLSHDLGCYHYLPYKYKMDEQIIRRVLKGNVNYIGGGVSVKYIIKDGKYYALINYSRASLELASNVVRAFGSALPSYQNEIKEVSDNLKPEEGSEDKTIELEVTLQDIMDSFSNTSVAYSPRFLPEELLNDEEFILALHKKGISSVYFCSLKLKEDVNFMEKALEIDYNATFPYIPASFWENDEFVEFIISLWEKLGDGHIYSSPVPKVPARYKNNKEYALRVVNVAPSSYNHLSDELKKDKEIGLLVVNKAPRLLPYLDPVLLDDIDIVSIAIETDRQLLKYASPRVREVLKK